LLNAFRNNGKAVPAADLLTIGYTYPKHIVRDLIYLHQGYGEVNRYLIEKTIQEFPDVQDRIKDLLNADAIKELPEADKIKAKKASLAALDRNGFLTNPFPTPLEELSDREVNLLFSDLEQLSKR
jgi:hypothetical protein